ARPAEVLPLSRCQTSKRVIHCIFRPECTIIRTHSLHQQEGRQSRMANMRDVLGLILGGGRGARLYPLTQKRAKPAVPIAGKYRLIDIPISNCLNSGIEKIAILTQFKSVSLHRHVMRTYAPRDIFTEGWIEILAAEQSEEFSNWYQGTADAVRQQWIEIENA